MDDIVIDTNSVTEMFKKIRRLFGVLRELILTINMDKCEFVKWTVEFFGHEVVIIVVVLVLGKAKTYAIAVSPTLTSVKKVRQFIGLMAVVNLYWDMQ